LCSIQPASTMAREAPTPPRASQLADQAEALRPDAAAADTMMSASATSSSPPPVSSSP
jgi:hypothetical protein